MEVLFIRDENHKNNVLCTMLKLLKMGQLLMCNNFFVYFQKKRMSDDNIYEKNKFKNACRYS